MNIYIRTVVIAVFVFIFVSHIFVLLMRNKLGDTYKELNSRMISWWVMSGILTGVLLISRVVTFIFFAISSYLALKEYFTLLPTRRVDRRLLWIAYLSIPIQYWFVTVHWYGMFSIFVPVYMFIFIPVSLLFAKETRGFLMSASTIQWGLMVAVFSLSHAPYLLVLPEAQHSSAGSTGLLIFLILVTEANDVASYIFGKIFGKHKLAPTISPKKTVEGMIGGIVVSMILAYVLGQYLTPFNSYVAIGLGLGGSIMGLAGDLTMSAVKRDLGVKDTGELIPGHGGVLDRIDSLLFNAPLLLHFTRYFYK